MTLTGGNEVARGVELRHLIAQFEASYGDMAVERLDGAEVSYERMHEAVQGVPFLTARKLVILHNPSACAEFVEKFEAFVNHRADTNTVVIVEPKLDKRLSYYKQLKRLTDFKEFASLDANGLRSWVVEYTNEHAGSISLADAQFLIERTGAEQTALRHELDKLMGYSMHITRSTIELLTEKTPQGSIFDLLDAAFGGDAKRAMQLYDEQRALKVEPQQIMAMLTWQLHVLALVLTAKGRNVDDIAREAKLNPFVVRKTMGLVRSVDLRRLKKLVTQLREFDVRTKTESVIADEIMRFYLVSMAR